MTDPIVEKVARIIEPDYWHRLDHGVMKRESIGIQYSLEKAATIHALYSERMKELEDKFAKAREQFFCMIADARRWEEDVDGDADEYGRVTTTVIHFAEFCDSNLRDLLEAFDIPCRYDESAADSLDRAMEAAPGLKSAATTPESGK